MQRLKDRVSIVSGAASGIGLAIATLFAEEGSSVLLADFNKDNLDVAVSELQAKFGDKIAGTLADVRKMADGERIVSEAVAKFGGVDVLVANAAIPSSSHIEDLTEEHFDNVIATNLKGMFTVIKPVIPEMKKRGGGKIVTLGSEMGFAAVPESPAYNASKGGVIMFTKSLALDLIRYNIRVNSLCPGVTMTPLLEQEIAAAPDPFKHREMQNTWAPINRVSSPREQAYGALFLAGDESSFSVGATLVLDGGFLSR